MKKQKNFIWILCLVIALGTAVPSKAIFSHVHWGVGIWLSPLAYLGRLANVLAGYKLTKTEIDATEGFEKIKENIGMNEEASEESGEESSAPLMSEETYDNAEMIPDAILSLIEDPEENSDGKKFYSIREANTQILFADYCSDMGSDTTLYVQRECTDEEKINLNQGCDACQQRNSEGQCISYDSAQCARERQNYWLTQSTSGVEATLDAHGGSARSFYGELSEWLTAFKEEMTVMEYWSRLQELSVQANSIVPEITFVYAMDLLSTSEMRVNETGVDYQTLSINSTGDGS